MFSLFERIPAVLSTIWLTRMVFSAPGEIFNFNKDEVCGITNFISGSQKEIMEFFF